MSEYMQVDNITSNFWLQDYDMTAFGGILGIGYNTTDLN